MGELRHFIFIGLLSVSLAFLLSSCATESIRDMESQEAVPSEISAAELFKKMKKASDPDGLLASAKSYYLKQKLQSPEKKIFIEMTFEFPDKSRTVTTIDGKVAVTMLFNGENSCIVTESGKKVKLAEAEIERFKLFNAIGGTAKENMSEVFEKITVFDVGSGPDGLYKLVCIPKYKDLAPIVIYVSREDFLTKKIITEKGGKPYVAIVRKYSLIDGVMVAAETEIRADGRNDILITIDYRLNVETNPAMFIP